MIIDSLNRWVHYRRLHPHFVTAFEYLNNAVWNQVADGRHAIVGDAVFVILASDSGRGRDASPLESHRKFIDIQYVISGGDEMGWLPIDQCSDISMPYDPERDLAFFGNDPTVWCPVAVGQFAIFFPSDGHAPLAGSGPIRKAVIKVAVESK